jgi:uncharacterized metal-binding protein YceD (DUF177 family)
MSDKPVFSHHISAQDVPDRGTHVNFGADAAEREAMARFLGIPEVLAFEARLHITPFRRSGLAVRGTVEAEITQICGVTLEPFANRVREEVDATFVPEADLPRSEEVPGAEYEADLDAPDVLENGGVDLGALVLEHLALGMDPYPRSPDAALLAAEPVEAEPVHRPFAGLEGLLGAGNGKKSN